MGTTYISLFDEEIVHLDGRCNIKTQEKVNEAKARLAMRNKLQDLASSEAGLIADVVSLANKEGRVICRNTSISHCKICGKYGGYAKYKRSSMYHRKGQDDHSRPLYFSGIEFEDRWIISKGSVYTGCCLGCFSKIQSELTIALKLIRAEISERITGHPPKFICHRKRHCTACDWKGHEGQLGKLLTMMGNGYYRGQCPNCGHKDTAFRANKIKIIDGFEVISNET